MKTESLEALGLDSKAIKAIMQLHEQSINDELLALAADEVDTWKNRAEIAETALADQKAAYKTEKETACKTEALTKAIIGYQHAEMGKLNPRQADLLITAFGAKAEYTEKKEGDKTVYSVKNINVIMADAISHGGFEFAKGETKTAVFGSFQQSAPPQNEKPNLTAALLGGGTTND